MGSEDVIRQGVADKLYRYQSEAATQKYVVRYGLQTRMAKILHQLADRLESHTIATTSIESISKQTL